MPIESTKVIWYTRWVPVFNMMTTTGRKKANYRFQHFLVPFVPWKVEIWFTSLLMMSGLSAEHLILEQQVWLPDLCQLLRAWPLQWAQELQWQPMDHHHQLLSNSNLKVLMLLEQQLLWHPTNLHLHPCSTLVEFWVANLKLQINIQNRQLMHEYIQIINQVHELSNGSAIFLLYLMELSNFQANPSIKQKLKVHLLGKGDQGCGYSQRRSPNNYSAELNQEFLPSHHPLQRILSLIMGINMCYFLLWNIIK